jgi:hypothetical protein
MEGLIILWLWLKAAGFLLTVAFIILVAAVALVWGLGAWLFEKVQAYRNHIV